MPSSTSLETLNYTKITNYRFFFSKKKKEWSLICPSWGSRSFKVPCQTLGSLSERVSRRTLLWNYSLKSLHRDFRDSLLTVTLLRHTTWWLIIFLHQQVPPVAFILLRFSLPTTLNSQLLASFTFNIFILQQFKPEATSIKPCHFSFNEPVSHYNQIKISKRVQLGALQRDGLLKKKKRKRRKKVTTRE